MADCGNGGVDLFGLPVRARHGMTGRPKFVPDAVSRAKVQLGLALGWSNERIASAIGISQPTLRSNFLQLLKARALQRDAMDLQRFLTAFKAAESGNVGAMRLLDKLLEKNDLVLVAARERGVGFVDEPVVKALPKGKKDAALAKAQLQIADDPFLPKPERAH